MCAVSRPSRAARDSTRKSVERAAARCIGKQWDEIALMANPKMPVSPDARADDLTGKVLSFGYFSLHQQRKVTRLPAKAVAVPFKSRAFALKREFISFAGTKETNQRKVPSPIKAKSQSGRWPEFSDSPFHGSVGKRRPSMAAALRVCPAIGCLD